MSLYEQELKAMTDEDLSTEWVRAMTVPIDPGNREAQLAVIDAVADEVNSRYEAADFSSLVISPADAKSVSDHLKQLIRADGMGWFEDEEQVG